MQHYAAFHLGLHRLPKYPCRGFQYTKKENYGTCVQIVTKCQTVDARFRRLL